jgi:SAM-dependent methyltransferase
MNRMGDPFKWVDGDQIAGQFIDVDGTLAVLQYLAMSGEIYPLPASIKTSDAEQILSKIRGRLTEAFTHFVPFQTPEQMGFAKYIESTATVKQQDYCALRTMCPDLKTGLDHLDIGPGLGANAIYSRLGLDSTYYSLEAYPASYQVQRSFLRALSAGEGKYFDTIDCENLEQSDETIATELNSKGKYHYKHVPSWHADLVKADSIDLVTATWVLNELNAAGICWILTQVHRTLKPGGYFYIRDSHKLKPQRHDLSYDDFLISKLGYRNVKMLDVKNRVDIHGVPRVYQKVSASTLSFEDVYELAFGRFAVTSHGGAYTQK